VCYREIVQIGDTSTNYQLAPGDRVFVPSMTLCQQISEALHGSPEPECPPCGLLHAPCDLGSLEHGSHEYFAPEVISSEPTPAELPAPQSSTAKPATKVRR
jgi:polysaccharide export outer membrane protein